MLQNIKITIKYPIIIVTLALLAALANGFTVYWEAHQHLHHAVERQLSIVRDSHRIALDNYIKTLHQEANFASQAVFVHQALRELKIGWGYLGDNPGEYLQKHYVNKDKTEKKPSRPPHTNKGSYYKAAHQELHPYLLGYQQLQTYYDLFLIDPQGNVIYSVEKNHDFASNILHGNWKNTGLAKVFQAAVNSPRTNFQVYSEFDTLQRDTDRTSSFFAIAILNKQGKLEGVMAVQIPTDNLNQIIQRSISSSETCETCETYLVSNDHLLRSTSKPKNAALNTWANSVAINRALDGETGVIVTTSYRGTRVVSAYAPFNYFNNNWAILADIDESQVMKPLDHMRQLVLFNSLISAVLITIIGLGVSQQLVHPIITLTAAMSKLADRNLDQIIPFAHRKDEIGEMSKALQIFKDNAIQRQSTEIALRDSETMLAEAQRLAKIGSWAWDVQTNEHHWTDELFKIYGYKPMESAPIEELLKRGVHPEDMEDFRQYLLQVFNENAPTKHEFRIIQPNGSVRLLSVDRKIMKDNEGKPNKVVGTVIDITDTRESELRIQYLANHDPLTKLPSLRLARDRLDSALAAAERHKTKIALMFIDLDEFKDVNDNLGHDAGDTALKEVSKRLSSCVRKTDTVARIGGDEFLIIQVDIKEALAAQNVAEKLIDSVSRPIIIRGHNILIGASVGIALYPDNGDSADTLIKRADEAMYKTKKAGKNNFSFSSEN